MGETIAVNRKARHEYAIEDTLEAGLVLTGTEIKSIRAGKVNLAGRTRPHRARRGVAGGCAHRALGRAATATTTSVAP